MAMTVKEQISVLNTMRQKSQYLATSSNGNAKKAFEKEVEALDSAISLLSDKEQKNE